MFIETQWPLVIFSLLAGVGGTLGAFAALALLLKKAEKSAFVALIVALVLFVLGGLASMLHLASPQNAMAAATNLLSFSGISVELIMLGASFIAMLALAIMVKRGAEGTALKVVAVLVIICGLVLAFVCGHGYVIDARQYWNTNLLPLAYLGSVLPAGGLLYLALEAFKDAEADLKSLELVTLIAAVVSAITLVVYLVFVGGEIVASSPVVTYGGIIVCGIVITLAAAAGAFIVKGSGAVKTCLVVGIISSVIGALCLRVFMWVASNGFMDLFGLATERMFAGM